MGFNPYAADVENMVSYQ